MNEEFNEEAAAEIENGLPADGGGGAVSELDRISAENERLRLELQCAELGVKKEFRDDVIRLAEGSSVADVVGRYPAFLGCAAARDTGMYLRSEQKNTDLSLRRAFGLK